MRLRVRDLLSQMEGRKSGMPIQGMALVLGGVLLVVGCSGAAPRPGTATGVASNVITEANVREELSVLAHDSMQGRATGTEGIRRAARYLDAKMREIGLEPAGDDGFLQRVPLAPRTGRGGLRVLLTQEARDSVPADQVVMDANVVGVIRGSDPAMRNEAVIVGAHYDHVGIGNPVDGDSIYNGADDDASGTVAVLEIARALRAGNAPRRTIVFALFTGEERGGFGASYYAAHPVVPLDNTIAQFQIEMIARPDSMAGGHGKAWLTGYERSTMGGQLNEAGIAIVPDPRPDQRFFQRSDNYRFALLGIPAHTLSSFEFGPGHPYYHRPSDEIDNVDFAHMTAVIREAARAARVLADGPRPEWHPGGRPGGG
jgi:hypothetical protein